jgi:predicted ATP-grasp superfamily ATP-dependent carboligase
MRLSSALRSAGLNSARCLLTPEEVPTDGSWLVKPLMSAGGNHIFPWHGDLRGYGYQPQHTAAGCRCYFQERIDGLPASAIYVAVEGQAEFLGATRQLLGLPWCFGGGQPDFGYRYCGSVGTLDCSASQTEQFRVIGQALASTFGLRGLFGVDAVLSGDEIWPIEVNPRYTASVEILERLGGFGAIALHVAACQKADRRTFSASSASSAFEIWKPGYGRRKAAKAELYAPTNLEINDEFLNWTRRQNHEHSWPNVSDISPLGTVIHRGHPIVTIFAEGPDDASVVQRLMDRAAEAYSALAVSALSANNLPAGVSKNS